MRRIADSCGAPIDAAKRSADAGIKLVVSSRPPPELWTWFEDDDVAQHSVALPPLGVHQQAILVHYSYVIITSRQQKQRESTKILRAGHQPQGPATELVQGASLPVALKSLFAIDRTLM